MTKKDKLGIGIIGLGAISRVHIDAFRRIEKAELMAVCTRNGEKAKQVAKKEDCDWYTDYRDMIDTAGIDAVVLCTPSGARMEIAEYAARHKKHVISEKPLEVTTKRIDAMIKACEKNGVYIASIFHKRYHPVYKWIKKTIDEGRFGDIISTNVLMKWYRPDEYYADSNWRGTWKLDGGGALMNQCVHFIDLMQWFNGGVDSVFARTGNKLHKNIETEDTAVGNMLFSNGAFGLVEATTSSYPGFSTILTLNGTRGGVICENEAIRELKMENGTKQDEDMKKDSKFGEHGRDAGTNIKKDITLHLEQLTEITDALLEGKQPPVEGREARKAVEIVTAMYESAKKGTDIKLGDFKGANE